MANDLVRFSEHHELGPLIVSARNYVRDSKAKNTLRAYRADCQDFSAWCTESALEAIPAAPQTLALYLARRAETCKVSTLERRIVAINQAHAAAGRPSPTSSLLVRSVMNGIRRTKGTAPAGKSPTLIEDIRRMVAALPSGPLGIRDRALLLLGFAGAFRRSELVSIDLGDCAFTSDGLVVTLRRSKTDQEAAGYKIGIPYGSSPDTCPIRALKAWLEHAKITENGPVFLPVSKHGKLLTGRLAPDAVARAVKRYAKRIGLDPDRYGGHSLRAGLATAAAIGGADERSIMNQTRHKSLKQVRAYIRDGNLFRDNAAARVGM